MATGLSNASGLSATSSSLILRALNSGFSYSGSPSSPSAAFFSAVTAAGGTISAPRQVLYTNLFNSLTSAGLMTVLDRLGIFAAENQATANVDLIDPTKSVTPLNNATINPVFTANAGYSSTSGSQGYLNTNANASTLARYTQNSATWALGSLSVRATNGDVVSMGTYQAAGGAVLFMRSSGPSTVHGVNNTNIFNSNLAPPPAAAVKGLYVASRTASNVDTLYFNGTSVNVSSELTTASLSSTFLICCWRAPDNATFQQFTDDNVCLYALGGGMTSTQATNLTTILNTYMTAVGNPLF